MPAGFLVTSFDSSGKLIQESTLLNKADPLTYEAERLFGIDLNYDDVQGRNVQEFSRDQFTAAKNIETYDGASDNKTLLTDANSGELLAADSSDTSIQTLLTNKDGSSFVAASHHTAIDIEQSDDGHLRLLCYRDAHETTKRVRVGRSYREVTENVSAGFLVTSFDSVSYTHLTLPTILLV